MYIFECYNTKKLKKRISCKKKNHYFIECLQLGMNLNCISVYFKWRILYNR